MPLFHATGCHSVMVSNLAAGGKLVMMHHFDPERALELIERERITTFGGVPAMVMQVLDSPNFAKYDTSSIRSVSYGGAPAPPDLVRRIRAAWPDRAAVERLRPDRDLVGHLHELGRRLRRQARERRSGRSGLRRGHHARGLHRRRARRHRPPRPRCPGRALDQGAQRRARLLEPPRGDGQDRSPTGWLHTGDVARLDEDDFIYIVDRAKDMIIRGGENVYSVQVEAALFEHPAVADCAVIGVPRSHAGRGGGRGHRAPARRQGHGGRALSCT